MVWAAAVASSKTQRMGKVVPVARKMRSWGRFSDMGVKIRIEPIKPIESIVGVKSPPSAKPPRAVCPGPQSYRACGVSAYPHPPLFDDNRQLTCGLLPVDKGQSRPN